MITHNGFMDLLYFYEKFYDTLPGISFCFQTSLNFKSIVVIFMFKDTIEEFKKNINELFPVIYDTKHISTECRKVSPIKRIKLRPKIRLYCNIIIYL